MVDGDVVTLSPLVMRGEEGNVMSNTNNKRKKNGTSDR